MKLKFLSISMVALGLMAAMSCEKEEIRQTPVKAEGKLKSTAMPYFEISLANSWFCGYKVPCGTTTLGFSKNNEVVVTNLTYSIYQGVTYSYYRRTAINGNLETYQPIPGAQYYCTSSTNSMANGYLNNNTKILVFANVGTGGPNMNVNLIFDTSLNNLTNYPSMSSPSDFEIIMTGTYKGKPCADEEPPCSDCDPT